MRFEELPISDKSKTTSQLARFNDYARKFHPEIVKFKLVKKNKSVTNENLINYLLLAALYENFGISIEGDKLFYFNLVKAFYRGIDTHTLTSMLGTLNKLLQDESKATLILDSLLSTYVMPKEPSSDEKRVIQYNTMGKRDRMTMKYFINHYMQFEEGDEKVYEHLQRILLKNDDLGSSIELFEDFFTPLHI